ncbi:MAG: ABC transporter substrate-binding protein [Acidimicrobiales bacterium]|jgi:branched-chain amino acid transport system substrate-binding protein
MLENNELSTPEREWSRRSLLQGGLAGLGAIGVGGAVELDQAGAAAVKRGKTIKFGYVSPETGPLAPFGAADAFVISALKSLLAKGVTIKGVNYPIEIIVKDSQSTDATAASVAEDLIKNDKVDVMLVSSTPDTTNPVSDQCEANQVPCISTVAPWQSWFFGRGATPTTKYKWTYHFFWGLEDIEAVYSSIWSAVPNNKTIGGLWPNDSDGDAFASTTQGFPAFAKPLGYNIVDPGRYADLTTDFTAQIAAFRNGNCEILTGVPIPPDFITFYKQAASQGYIPKIATIAKAMLFPSSAQALGALAVNIGTEYWWGPTHPFISSLTGQNCAHIAAAYEKKTGDQWTQPIGFVHALFEVAIATLKKSGQAHNKNAFVTALSTLKLNTIVGPLNWQGGATRPVPNVAKTPLVGGQWRTGNTQSGYALVVVTNNGHTNIPVASSPEVIPGATV